MPKDWTPRDLCRADLKRYAEFLQNELTELQRDLKEGFNVSDTWPAKLGSRFAQVMASIGEVIQTERKPKK